MLRNLRIALFLVHRAVSRGNKGTFALTVLIITLAFVNMTFVSSIMSGVVDSIHTAVKENYVGNIVVEPTSDEHYIERVAQLEELIETTPGVVACSPRYSVGATVTYRPDEDDESVRQVSWPMQSFDPGKEKQVTHLHEWLVAGEFLDERDRDQILLGREVSGGYGAEVVLQSLRGIEVGDELWVSFGNGIKRTYTVKGIIATKFPLVDMGMFITEKEMESVIGLHDRASQILIRTEEPGQEHRDVQRLRERGLTEVELHPWTDYLGFFKSLTDSLFLIARMVSGIGLLVAGITIFIVIYITVVGRRRQIGILKALGMNERVITMSYVLQALLYGLIGIGLGVCVMYFGLLPRFNAHPLQFPMGAVSLVITARALVANAAGLVAVSIVGGFVPSSRVARADIIKAIWG
ncbi:MAG: ABC transporter permease [Chloroflexi bacterium]|nr:ABC transporter permease [Chloroflexota bacterium]